MTHAPVSAAPPLPPRAVPHLPAPERVRDLSSDQQVCICAHGSARPMSLYPKVQFGIKRPPAPLLNFSPWVMQFHRVIWAVGEGDRLIPYL